MASNSIGQLFRVTTFGESHGKAIGAVIDGCPAGLELSEADLLEDLARRAPGKSPFTTPRKEQDKPEILSGVFEGKTTGAPIAIVIWNSDADSTKYAPIKDLYRPGHANYTYLEKYGIFDWRGGGRSSARETACRVAAGAVAKKILRKWNVEIVAYMIQIGTVRAVVDIHTVQPNQVNDTAVFCPDPVATEQIVKQLYSAIEAGDSLGGVIEVVARNVPVGLGDPVYEKIEANLAKAMMGLPASKGFEIGEGFLAASMRGSEHNDHFFHDKSGVHTDTNHAGGSLGGITTGMPIVCRTAFKPTSSIKIAQPTVDSQGQAATFVLPEGSRHDPCVAIRAVPIVEAMTALVLVDALLLNRAARL